MQTIVFGYDEGEPAKRALARAAELIVVGTREPAFISRLFGQSVSGGVQRHARCDVLIAHG
jgi:nucleotide-binding universal stress UspA family protein